MKTIKGVKAFNKGLKCRNYQFEEHKTFKQGGIPELCENGKPIVVKSAKITGRKLKADTYYKLVGGKFVEA